MDVEEKLAQTQLALQKAAGFGKQLAEDNAALRSQIQHLQEQLAHGGSDGELKYKLEQMTRNYEESQNRVGNLEQTVKELVNRMESKEGEVGGVETRLLELLRHVEELELHDRSLNHKLKSATQLADQAAELNEEMENLRGKLNEANLKEQSQTRLLASLEERLSASKAHADDSHSKNQSENELLLKQVEKLKDEISAKNTKISRLEAFQSTMEELQSQSAELVETINELKEENSLLKRQLEVKDSLLAQAKAKAKANAAQLAASNPSPAPVLADQAFSGNSSKKASLHSLLSTSSSPVSSPSHSRSPSNGGSSVKSDSSEVPTVRQEVVVDIEAQNLLKQQQSQLNNMAAALEAREKDMFEKQKQVMEALTKINLSLVASRPKPPGTCVVLLGNLPEEVIYTPDSMEELLGDCGEIKSFRWVSKDGEFLGFGFIEFHHSIDADKAVAKNGRLYSNHQISIDYATREEFEAGKPVRAQ